jgi:hypothetical protein
MNQCQPQVNNDIHECTLITSHLDFVHQYVVGCSPL